MKTKTVRPSFVYPESQDRRGGCKVSWLYYKEKSDAEAASKVAKQEAVHQMNQGYDFGYCMPGTIQQLESWKDMGTMYEVCIP